MMLITPRCRYAFDDIDTLCFSRLMPLRYASMLLMPYARRCRRYAYAHAMPYFSRCCYALLHAAAVAVDAHTTRARNAVFR